MSRRKPEIVDLDAIRQVRRSEDETLGRGKDALTRKCKPTRSKKRVLGYPQSADFRQRLAQVS